MKIESIEIGHYRVPLPVTLTDFTDGDMSDFELVTVRIRDADGAEGLGYTYTVGRGGAAIASLIVDLKPPLIGLSSGRIEWLWQKMWWGLHFVVLFHVLLSSSITPRPTETRRVRGLASARGDRAASDRAEDGARRNRAGVHRSPTSSS